MQNKKLVVYFITIIFILGFCLMIDPAVSCTSEKGKKDHKKSMIPSEDEIFGWIEDMWGIGNQGPYGYRMPGTGSYWEGADYVLEKFEEAGLEDTFLEPVPATVNFPDQWKLMINAGGNDEEIPCYFLRYANFTPPEGVSAEIVYVGTGSDTEFSNVDATEGIEGKIVLVDVIAAPWPRAILEPFILFEWDPDNTFANDPMATENWPLANLDSSYNLAYTYGAVGYIGIMTCMADYVNQYLHWYFNGELPAFTVSPNDGNHLKELLTAGSVSANMILTGTEGPGTTYNVYGSLPGKTDDIIMVVSHHDGWATNEASGVSIVMALAKYFAQIPKYSREKTLMFVSFGSHFGKKADWTEYDSLAYNVLPKVACAINIEMISKQIKVIDGEFVETGLVAPRGMFLSGPLFSANEYLLSYASEAIVKNDMVRTSCLPGAFAVPGEGGKFYQLGIPTINFISHNAPQFTQYDTPETVAKDALVPTTKMFIDIINDLDVTPSSLLKWTMTVNGRETKAYPELRESIWEMRRDPYGPFDKIGLHRLVKADIEPEGVVFILPGTWSNGEQLTSNPPDDWWTADEDHSFAFYLANRNFDVYAIDYRTHFVNEYLNPPDLGLMAYWGWDQWISDIKEAVELAKAISGANKVYMAGDSFGGSAVMNYASLYWKEDLKGILLRDGGTGTKYPELVTNSFNLPAVIAGMIAAGSWANEVGGAPGSTFVMQYADQNPTAPAEFPPGTPLEPTINPFTGLPWENIQEWAAFMIYMAWGPGVVSNIYGGYGDPAVMIHIDATFDRYWPSRLSLESAAISDWDNCPYVSFDFDDHYSEIDVPILAFTSELMGLAYWGPFRRGTANPDFTGIYLWGYGHLDVYSGEYSAEQVSQPTVEWLMSHRMLVGYGRLSTCKKYYWGEAAIYINATTIEFRMYNTRMSWNIINHQISRKQEIFKGKSDYSKITVIIKKGFALGSGYKIFFFGYLV
ncbi:MAG: serine aminopeptidase domain-containing protein [Promethearchaeota archaeon]